MSDPQSQAPTPPPFDPSKPHHTKPKLRPVRPIQLQHNDQPVLGLRDATQISERMVVTSPLAQFILGHMDGNREISGIIEAAKVQAQQVGVPPQAIDQITEQPIQALVAQLDDAGLLEGPTFEAMRNKVREQFDSSDVLPPAASADFADALVAQELGEDATDEQKKAMGPQKLADQLDQFMDEAMKNAEDPAFDTLPKAVIAPHLDYGRGWLNYAHTYARLRVADRPDRVIILGTNHFGQGTGVVGCDKGYETPLGTCQADTEFLSTLKEKLGSDNAEKLMAHRFDHEREHSIELHIPWIQQVFRNPDSGEFPRVLGILVHDPLRNNGESYDGNGLGLDPFVDALKATLSAMPGKTLLVSSADLSHIGKAFGDQQSFTGEDEASNQMRNKVLQHDKAMIELIQQGKPDELITSMSWQQNPTRWCSIGNLVATMRATDANEVKMLHYAAAGDQQGMALVSSMAGAIFEDRQHTLNSAYQTIPTAFTGLGAILIIFGLALLFRSRKQPHKAMIRVPTIGPLTPVSHALIGMALAGAGYHLAVHALGLPQFRAPLRIALVVAGIFIVCTILADGMDLAGQDASDEELASERPGFADPEKWDERT